MRYFGGWAGPTRCDSWPKQRIDAGFCGRVARAVLGAVAGVLGRNESRSSRDSQNSVKSFCEFFHDTTIFFRQKSTAAWSPAKAKWRRLLRGTHCCTAPLPPLPDDLSLKLSRHGEFASSSHSQVGSTTGELLNSKQALRLKGTLDLLSAQLEQFGWFIEP